MVSIVLIERVIKVILVAFIATSWSNQIAAQTSQLADVPESCTETDPRFAHRLSERKESLYFELERNRALLDALEKQYAEGHPDVVAAKRQREVLSQQFDAADAVTRSDCVEQVNLQGEWAPAGLTLEDWREIIGETQRTAYRVLMYLSQGLAQYRLKVARACILLE